jgi:O-antigen/teichoic acid export membrane protein
MSAAVQTKAMEAPAPQPSLPVCFAISAFWSLSGAVASRGLTLAASVLAGRLLGATGFGEVGMIQSTQGLFGVLAGTSLGLAATKFVAEHRATDPVRARRSLHLGLIFAAAAGLPAAIVLLLFAADVASGILNAPHLAGELQVATGLIVLGAINGVQTGALAGLGLFRAIALLATLRGACLFVAMVVGITLGGVMGAVAGLVLTEAVAVMFNHLALRRLLPVPASPQPAGAGGWTDFGVMARFTGLAILGSLATTLAMWFSNVILAGQADGYAALGIFNAADRWRQLLLFLPASLSPIILSMLSSLHGSSDPRRFRQLFGLNLGVSAAVVLVPAVGLAFFAPLAMSLFGQEYQEGRLTLVILAASAIAVVLNNLLGQVLVSQGAIWWRFLLDVVLGGVLALVAWQAVPLYQDRGLALANLVAYSVTVLGLLPPVVYFLKHPRSRPVPSQPE